MIQLGHSTAVAHKTAGGGEDGALENCGNAVARSQDGKGTARAEKKIIIRNDKTPRLRRGQFGKCTFQLRGAACTNEFDLRANYLSGRKSFMNQPI